VKETAMLLQRGTPLVGVLTEADGAAASRELPTAIILNAGLIHRVGPGRLHVRIARRLALLGFRAFRFDLSGVGDSPRRRDSVPFDDSSIREVRQAMDELTTAGTVGRFVLMGICSGANVAFHTACRDGRVIGIAAVNGTFLDAGETQRLSQRVKDRVQTRYYLASLTDYRKWMRILRGRTDLRGAVRLMMRRCSAVWAARDRSCQHPARVLGAWKRLADRGVDSLLVYSEGSAALDAFSLTLRAPLVDVGDSGQAQLQVIDNADHVFTLLESQERLLRALETWALGHRDRWRPATHSGNGCITYAATGSTCRDD
jgi:pimeloyl-ACP methyl ester carboxylesterase